MLTKQTCLLICSFLLMVPTATCPWFGLTTLQSTSSCSEHKGALAFFGGVVALGGYLAWRCKKRTRIVEQRNQFLINNPECLIDEIYTEMTTHGGYCYTQRELGSAYNYPLPSELSDPDAD